MEAASIAISGRSRLARGRGALTGAEWRRRAVLAAVIIGLHVTGLLLLLVLVVPRHLSLGAGGAFGVGIGITAYTLGMRHAFDADHIGAIDNTTRKLMADGQRPKAVGFWFAMGHSTLVLVMAVLVMVGAHAVGALANGDSPTRHALGFAGTLASGLFLYLI